MAMNLNSVLRIAAEVTGLQDLGKLEKGLQGAEKAARSAKDGFKAMLDSDAFRAAAAAAAGLGVAIGLSAKAAIEFESSMADVRKVVAGLESPKAFKEISQEIMSLSAQMPIAAKGFAQIYAAAGQAGIARENLKEFATQVAQVAVAFDMTAEEAGTAMAKIMTSLGLTLPELSNLTDAMNHLSNNTASTAAELVDFTLRAGQAGKSVGLSAEQTAAFGAAMIAAGSTSEIAATSFNNMVKALSRGPSMTERQVSALARLGFAQSDAVVNERRYTDEVKQQSEQRIEAARQETDELSKEINRRFRDQMRGIQDYFEDEAEEYQRQADRNVQTKIKELQRLQDAEIDAATERAGKNEKALKAETNRIRDYYEERINAVRETAQQDVKEVRRINRDRLQLIQDDMDDRKDAELAGIKNNFEAFQKAEKAAMDNRIAEIKAQASAGATAAAEALAKGLQKDAIGTITDVFNRIRQLPAEARLSVISDLFGDEAKAILPLVNNTELLEKAMGLVADKTQYAGSTLQEFLTRSATTANQLQLAQNNLQNLSIVFGESFVPAITAALQALTPIIQAFSWVVQNVPLVGPIIATVTSAFVALVAIAPFISSLITVLGALGVTTAKIAGVVTVVQVAFSGLVSFLMGTILPAILAFFSGPAGWITLAIVAVGALVYAFREPLGNMLAAIGDFCGRALSAFNNALIRPLAQAWEKAVKFLGDALQGVGRFIGSIWDNIMTGIKNAVRYGLQYIANMINSVSRMVNTLINAFNRLPGPDIPTIPQIMVPAFAEGGVVNGPTLAVVGEGGQREYIVPESKAAGFANNYLMGARGAAAIPGFAQGGVVNGGANIGNTSINVTTGPVLQQDGKRYVTMNDLEQALNTVTASLLGNNRSAGGRRFQGV